MTSAWTAAWTFGGIFLLASTSLFFASGWFHLAKAFPDRDATPTLALHFRSGTFATYVSIGSFLSFTVCRTGLRVGINPLIAPLWRPFFVPWNEIELRRSGSDRRRATFSFGRPAVGTLAVTANLADRIIAASRRYWHPANIVTEPAKRASVRRLVAEWATRTALAAMFFTAGPWIAGDRDRGAPLTNTILFPAIVLGGYAIVRYVAEKHHVDR